MIMKTINISIPTIKLFFITWNCDFLHSKWQQQQERLFCVYIEVLAHKKSQMVSGKKKIVGIVINFLKMFLNSFLAQLVLKK